MQGKRYSYDDPLLRVYVRLYGRPVPPTDADIVREVRAYAAARMPAVTSVPAGVSVPIGHAVEAERASGIIEID